MAKQESYQRYNEKTVRHTIRVNPQAEPLIASRLAALKKAGKATAFFKDALRDLQEMDT